jgi:hypothetical protein
MIPGNKNRNKLTKKYNTNVKIQNRISDLKTSIDFTETAIKHGIDDKENVSFYITQLRKYRDEKSQLEKLKPLGTKDETKLEASKTLSSLVDKKQKESSEQFMKNLKEVQNRVQQMNKNKSNIDALRANLLKNQNVQSKKTKSEELKNKLKLFRGIESVLFNEAFEEISEDYPSKLLFLLDLEQLVMDKGILNPTKVAWIATNQYDKYKGLLDNVKDIQTMLQQVHSRALSKQLVLWKSIRDERVKQKLDKPKSMLFSDKSFYGLLKRERDRREKVKESTCNKTFEDFYKNTLYINNNKEEFIHKVIERLRYIDKIDSHKNLKFFGMLILALIRMLKQKTNLELFDDKILVDTILFRIQYDDAFKQRVREQVQEIKTMKLNSKTRNSTEFIPIFHKIFTMITGKEYALK